MNEYRFIADSSHLFAIFLLLWRIRTSRSCYGISGKSQILYMIVFIFRYLDLFFSFISIYNTLMKITYLGATAATIYFIYFKLKATHNKDSDDVDIFRIIIPSVLLGLMFSRNRHVTEIFWTSSLFLESVSVLPQLFMIRKTREVDVVTSHHLFALGIYRYFYILNWFYKFLNTSDIDVLALCCGIIQTLLYLDFFYLYLIKEILGTDEKFTVNTDNETFHHANPHYYDTYPYHIHCLPRYSPFLNLRKEAFSQLKSLVRGTNIPSSATDFIQRMTNSRTLVTSQNVKNIIGHSESFLEDCLLKGDTNRD
ncbi:ER lumen protein-retaining receptor [Thelohanellus kitauei]|uniref:ER lumen protein-retaining receptor n=1 Tax=Thelohanellus kitauei TaxID=669202 RepID=A0A0C2MP83_THEKT|nr:ER lumen protein-retaining receptor [Thelohanellus kitauei]